jgi:exosortase
MSQLAEATQFVDLPVSIRRRSAVWQLTVLALLSAWLYSGILGRLAQQWWNDPNFSHGFLVPLFSFYILYRDRHRLRALHPEPSSGGLLIVACAMAVLILGTMGAELFLARVSLLFLILGLVVLFGGWNYAHAVMFPLCFLLLMIPVPTILFNQVTLPLQLLASQVAATVLPWLGIPVLREGNVINLPAIPLQVAEACSGIRSLMSLITLSIIYGFLLERSLWLRLVLVVAAIPIAICANSLRIIVTGLLAQHWSPAKIEGFFHSFSGWLVFVASLFMLFVLHQVLSRIHRRRRGSVVI